MRKGELERVVDLAGVSCERCQQTGDGGPDVGAQRQRKHAVHRDDADANERCHGGREDRAALDQNRHPGADQYRDVAGQVSRFAGEVGVDGFAHDALHRSAQHRVEYLDEQQETDDHRNQRADQQDRTDRWLAESWTWQTASNEQVPACNGTSS